MWNIPGKMSLCGRKRCCFPGRGALRMTLHFDGGIVAAENQTLRLPEMTLTVKEVRISALSLSMSICGGEEADTDALFDLLREATLRMKDGKTLKPWAFRPASARLTARSAMNLPCRWTARRSPRLRSADRSFCSSRRAEVSIHPGLSERNAAAVCK